MLRLSSRRGLVSGAALSSSARSSTSLRSSGASSRTGEEVPRQAGSVRFAALLVLTWNLYHGRAVPPAGRLLLLDEYGAPPSRAADWDVALLQEVPPWWPPELGRGERSLTRAPR